MKSIIRSKTCWLAVMQATVGVVVTVGADHHALGGLLVLKSILDIILRVVTTRPVTVRHVQRQMVTSRQPAWRDADAPALFYRPLARPWASHGEARD